MNCRHFEIITNLKKIHKITLHEASFSNGVLPRFILLDRTRNIHSYFDFYLPAKNILKGKYFKNKIEIQEELLRLLKIQYSTLERPLFLYIDQPNTSFVIEVSELREIALIKDFNKIALEDYKIVPEELFDKIKTEL